MLPSRIFLDDFFGDERKTLDKMMKCDIYEKDNEKFIEIDMPGAKKEDLNLDIEKGYLTISYEAKNDVDTSDRKYIHRERHETMACERRIYVGDVIEDKIKAEFKDGILTIKVPMESQEKLKKSITIE